MYWGRKCVNLLSMTIFFKNYMIFAGALFMKQLAQQIKDSNGDYSNLEGSPLLSPKVLMSNCVSDLNNMAETQAEIKVKFQIPI